MRVAEVSRVQSERLELKLTGADFWHIFVLPIGTVLIGVFLFVLGVTMGDPAINIGSVLGTIIFVISLVLIFMELRDLPHPVIEVSPAGIMISKQRAPELRLEWSEIRELRINELMVARRASTKQQQLYLEILPMNPAKYEAAHPELHHYRSIRFDGDSTVLPVGTGTTRKTTLDEALRRAQVPKYGGIIATVVEAGPRSFFGPPPQL